MKEVYYDGNLSKDIKIANSKININKRAVIALLANLTCIGLGMIIYSSGFPINTAMLLSLITGTIININIYNEINATKKIINKKRFRIRNFLFDLMEESGIELINDDVVTDKVDKIKNVFKHPEKAIKETETVGDSVYFYLLDRKERIQILKQYKKQLFLLEKNEIEQSKEKNKILLRK